MSNFMENNTLNYILKTAGGDTSGIRPSTAGLVYIALFTNPSGTTSSSLESNAGTGASIPFEVTGGSYARQRIYFNNPSSNGIISNSLITNWDVATTDWGIVTHYALLNIGITDFPGTLFWGVFDTPQNVQTGDRFVIYPGQLKVQIS